MANGCVIYAAKSTLDKHGSIPTQLQDCRQMAQREGWTILTEQHDENASAWKGDRGPGLVAAMGAAVRAASEHGSCVLVAQHSDRFARGDGKQARHLGELLFWAMRANVTLRSVQDDSTFTNPLLTFAMGERNAEDSRRKSESVKAGMARRALRGHYNGGPPPYGYVLQGPKGDRALVVHDAESVIVRRIFERFVGGHSQKQIARDLTRDGIPAQRGGEWHQGTVGRYLANPIYMGWVRLNGEAYEGQHPAIVEADLWERARALREAQARTPSKGRGRRPKGRHLFINGHLRCGRCDGAMIPRTYDDYEGHPAYGVYSCYRRVRLGPDACEQEPVKRESVDGAVMDYFASSVLDLEATQRQIASAVEHRLAEIRELHGQAERDERKAEDAIVRVKRDYVDGKLDVTDWQELRSELSADLEAARAKRERLQGQEARVASEARVDADSEALRYLSEIRAAVIGSVRNAHGVEAVRAALLTLFDGFTLRRIADSFDRDVFYTSLMCVGPRGAYEMEPHVREDAIAGYGPSGVTPKPRLIGLAQAENNYANGLQT